MNCDSLFPPPPPRPPDGKEPLNAQDGLSDLVRPISEGDLDSRDTRGSRASVIKIQDPLKSARQLRSWPGRAVYRKPRQLHFTSQTRSAPIIYLISPAAYIREISRGHLGPLREHPGKEDAYGGSCHEQREKYHADSNPLASLRSNNFGSR